MNYPDCWGDGMAGAATAHGDLHRHMGVRVTPRAGRPRTDDWPVLLHRHPLRRLSLRSSPWGQAQTVLQPPWLSFSPSCPALTPQVSPRPVQLSPPRFLLRLLCPLSLAQEPHLGFLPASVRSGRVLGAKPAGVGRGIEGPVMKGTSAATVMIY